MQTSSKSHNKQLCHSFKTEEKKEKTFVLVLVLRFYFLTMGKFQTSFRRSRWIYHDLF